MHLKQILAVALIALLYSVTCLPSATLRASREGRPRNRKTNLVGRTPYPHHGIIWKVLIPVLESAFVNAVAGVIANWFYPWRIVPYPPGKIGIAQLWGGYSPHGHHYRRRRRSSNHPLESPGGTTG